MAVIGATGAAVAIAGTLAVTRVTCPGLADVAATNPTLWAAVTALLALVGIGASLVPTRRATRVDPACALRAE